MHEAHSDGARARHWLFEAALGAAATLLAITAAHAALPDAMALARTVQPARTPAAAVAAQPAGPAQPSVLIAFADPVPGYEVVSPFGLRQLPWEAGGRLHAGVDIAAPAGLAVLATADGVVTRTGVDGGYGRFVEVEHAEGLKTRYGHLAMIGVAPGQAVKAGGVVGKVGSSGTSTGPHLHFEVRDAKGRPLNPALFMGRAFAAAADLPLKAAARISGRVRMAQVSRIPVGKLALMQAKLNPSHAPVVRTEDGRVHGILTVSERMDGLRQAARRDAEVRKIEPWAPPQTDASATEAGPRVIRVEG